jgi:integrase/recombinase XerC
MPDKELANLIDRWIEWLKTQRNYSNHTINGYLSDLKIFLDYISINDKVGIYTLKALDIRDFRNFFSYRAKNNINKTSIAREESSVRNFFKWLDDNNVMQNTAIFQISSPKLPKVLPRSLDVNTIIDVIEKATENCSEPWLGSRDKAIFTLLYGCGLRISEALSLRNCDVASHPDVLRIMGKGSKERLVPVLPIVWDAIDKYVSLRPFGNDKNDELFRSVRGLPMSPRMAQKVIEHLRHYLQLPDYVTPHALRHTFATALLADGADIRSLQELLGHSSLSTTQLYTKVNMAEITNAYENAHPRAQD